jgi:hypothetical protein
MSGTRNTLAWPDRMPATAAAHALAQRSEIQSTPRNGCWLNVAKTELSVSDRQCMDRRLDTASGSATECAAWDRRRKAEGSRVIWRFTTEEARIERRSAGRPHPGR